MDEKELRNLPINDEFGQCMRKLRVVSIEIKQKRQEEIKKCNHLFVKLRKGEVSVGSH